MNKTNLISSIATEAQITKVEAKKVVDAFVSVTSKTLKKGERISLPGWGTFTIVKRNARTGRDPRTGKPLKISAKKVVKFKAGANLAKQVK